MVLPSGDHTGWRASLNRSVIRCAGPPEAGVIHRLPCRSVTSCLPSGEVDTAIDVPSVTVTSTRTSRGETFGGSIGADAAGRPTAPSAATKAADRNSLRRLGPPLFSCDMRQAAPRILNKALAAA